MILLTWKTALAYSAEPFLCARDHTPGLSSWTPAGSNRGGRDVRMINFAHLQNESGNRDRSCRRFPDTLGWALGRSVQLGQPYKLRRLSRPWFCVGMGIPTVDLICACSGGFAMQS